MSILKRGEIWYVRISDPETSRAAVGTEMGAKREESCRLCVVVSSSDANECSSRVTVVPLTKYMDKKEISMGPGGFRVEHGRDVEFDANNENHAEGRLESGASYLSLVNCAQLWTLYAPTETEQGVDPDLPNDILHRCGELRAPHLLDAVLQGVIGGLPHRPIDRQELPYQEGDVLSLDLPGRPRQRSVVVSSDTVA